MIVAACLPVVLALAPVPAGAHLLPELAQAAAPASGIKLVEDARANAGVTQAVNLDPFLNGVGPGDAFVGGVTTLLFVGVEALTVGIMAIPFLLFSMIGAQATAAPFLMPLELVAAGFHVFDPLLVTLMVTSASPNHAGSFGVGLALAYAVEALAVGTAVLSFNIGPYIALGRVGVLVVASAVLHIVVLPIAASFGVHLGGGKARVQKAAPVVEPAPPPIMPPPPAPVLGSRPRFTVPVVAFAF